MTRLVQADRMETLAQIATLYNDDREKNISEHTTHWSLKEIHYTILKQKVPLIQPMM